MANAPSFAVPMLCNSWVAERCYSSLSWYEYAFVRKYHRIDRTKCKLAKSKPTLSYSSILFTASHK